MKKLRKNYSVAPKKTVELIDWRIEKQKENSDFIGPSVCGDQYTKESWPYLTLWIYCWSFWSTLGIFSHVIPMLNGFSILITQSWDFALSDITQSDWLRASWAINQELKFCKIQNLEREVKYHDNFNNSPFILFSEKSSDKTTKRKQNVVFWEPFYPNMNKNDFW